MGQRLTTMNRMRNICLIAILLIIAVGINSVYAQIPRQMSYQGLIVDQGGKAISDADHTFEIAIYDSPTTLTSLHSETFRVRTAAGIFNVILGTQTPFPANLTFDKQYWLGVSVDGGSEMTPRTVLTAVPYALNAATADIAKGVSSDARGVVTSVNEIDGPVRVVGDSVIKVTQSGNVITIGAKLPDLKGVPFNIVTSGTNRGQNLLVGDSTVLQPVGGGIVSSNKLLGSTIDASSYAGRIKVPKGSISLTVALTPNVGCTPNSSVTVSQYDTQGNEVLVGTMVTRVINNSFTVQFSAAYPTDTGQITYLVVNP